MEIQGAGTFCSGGCQVGYERNSTLCFRSDACMGGDPARGGTFCTGAARRAGTVAACKWLRLAVYCPERMTRAAERLPQLCAPLRSSACPPTLFLFALTSRRPLPTPAPPCWWARPKSSMRSTRCVAFALAFVVGNQHLLLRSVLHCSAARGEMLPPSSLELGWDKRPPALAVRRMPMPGLRGRDANQLLHGPHLGPCPFRRPSVLSRCWCSSARPWCTSTCLR